MYLLSVNTTEMTMRSVHRTLCWQQALRSVKISNCRAVSLSCLQTIPSASMNASLHSTAFQTAVLKLWQAAGRLRSEERRVGKEGRSGGAPCREEREKEKREGGGG